MISKAQTADLPELDTLYEHARHFMHTHGNPNQWNDGHPCARDLSQDIAQGILYVIRENGIILGAFSMKEGEDPTYQTIEGKSWRSDGAASLVLHKVCSSQKRKGIGHEIMTYAKAQGRDLRIDTHRDNRFMKALLQKEGFSELGVIRLANGDPRDAYEFLQEPAQSE